ncbi:hypothetical protein ASD24_26700 [Paenibacillus sp. Root52]|uniref:hypothetical protein n=1 Tax=Paenibacillus sp. Root52 TaxID=1736552 RepID=UPI00070233E8|nr:hypothetical protein [Paenibacillus sp. Root52]KQY87068.1 hypothetical protein ASD24_26700 [Paenibacillus sp. Root52]
MANHAQPKCPECKTEGIEQIISVESTEKSKNGDAWFEIVFCNQCGHVYGVFPKVVYKPTVNVEELMPPHLRR